MFRTPSQGDSMSVALIKLLQGGRRGSRAIFQFATEGVGQSEHTRSGIKLRNLAFHVWEESSLWALWIHSFHMHFSYLGPILFPCSSCILHSPSSSAITVGGGSTCWITVLGDVFHIWKPEIPDGGGISCLLIWQEIFSFHVKVRIEPTSRKRS